jgi:hypothetical protein
MTHRPDTRRITQFDQRAESITHDRQKDYGNPKASFDRIALMWSAITGADISAQQVAHMMIALKLCRLQHTPDHLDSLVDVVGYARCAVLVGPEYTDDIPFG